MFTFTENGRELLAEFALIFVVFCIIYGFLSPLIFKISISRDDFVIKMFYWVPIKKLSLLDIERVEVVSFLRVIFTGADCKKYGTRFWGKWVLVKMRPGAGRNFALSPHSPTRFAQRFAHLNSGSVSLDPEK